MKTVSNPVEELLKKLEGKLPEDLWEEVQELLSEQEKDIQDKKEEILQLEERVEDLESDLESAERDAEKTPDVYDLCAWVEGLSFQEQVQILGSIEVPYLKLHSSSDIMIGILAKQLEELIQKVGVEESVQLLSNPVPSW